MTITPITTFFEVQSVPENRFKEFVYDPSGLEAYFANTPPEGAELITTSADLRLWYIKPSCSGKGADEDVPNEPFSITRNITPLLKSHLQKAIRRKNEEAALRTAYTMALVAPSELLRRLPIIAIEDVILVSGTSVITWLMMTIKNRPLTKRDTRIILSYVEFLVSVNNTYKHRPHNPQLCRKDKEQDTLRELSHKEIVRLCKQHCPPETVSITMTEMLAFYYRYEFGGTRGDCLMIKDALRDYLGRVVKQNYGYVSLRKCSITNNDPPFSPACSYLRLYSEPEFPKPLIPLVECPCLIDASIDFHCYPWILKKISEKTGTAPAVVKELIWYVESSVNYRKDWTIKRADRYRQRPEWKDVKRELDVCRLEVLRRCGSSQSRTI